KASIEKEVTTSEEGATDGVVAGGRRLETTTLGGGCIKEGVAGRQQWQGK
ncbi:hypothetical protein BHM03_00062184, partial [Ensete ventricosum]